MGIFTSSSALRSFVEDAEVELPLPDEAIDNHEEIEDAHTGEIDPDPVVDPVEESYRIYAESERNFSNLMMAVGLSELRSYQESGIDYIHEAPDIRAFWEKVKTFFKTLKDKIWAVVKNFIARIQVRFQNGAKFVAKYSTQIKNGFKKLQNKNEDLKIKGYKFENTNWAVNFKENKKNTHDKIIADFGEFNNMDVNAFFASVKNGTFSTDVSDDDEEASRNLWRAQQLGQDSGSCSEEDYADELFKYYHSGETEKRDLELSDVDIDKILKVLKTGSRYVGNLKRNYREIERKCNESIKKANDFESRFAKLKHEDSENADHGKALTAINHIISQTKAHINIVNQANSAHMSAIKGELAQARRIALRCIQGDNKVDKKLFGESYYDSSASMINAVQFK
jgi:hypothetical protein